MTELASPFDCKKQQQGGVTVGSGSGGRRHEDAQPRLECLARHGRRAVLRRLDLQGGPRRVHVNIYFTAPRLDDVAALSVLDARARPHANATRRRRLTRRARWAEPPPRHYARAQCQASIPRHGTMTQRDGDRQRGAASWRAGAPGVLHVVAQLTCELLLDLGNS